MKANDKQAFAQYMMGIGEIYNQNVSKQKVSLYWQLLSQYAWEDVKTALDAYMLNPDNGQFMPKPADIIKWLSGNTQDQALVAWTKVANAISHVGPYQTVVFDDAKIHVVLADMGGWIKFESLTLDAQPFVAKEFQVRYQQYVRRPPTTYPKKLVGKTEGQNMIHGFPIPKPVLIGDQDLAEKVYLSGADNVKQMKAIENLLPQGEIDVESGAENDPNDHYSTIAL
jgi:hypothetical protein